MSWMKVRKTIEVFSINYSFAQNLNNLQNVFISNFLLCCFKIMIWIKLSE